MRGATKQLVLTFGLALELLAVTTTRVVGAEQVDGYTGDLRTSIVVRTSPTAPNYAEGVLISDTVHYLQQRSATFRDLLDVLMASPNTLTFLTPAPELQSKGLIGRTRFQTGPRHVVAFADVVVDRLNPSLRRLAVAHELAHVAEVACLGFTDSQAVLQQRMVAYVGVASPRPGAPIETGFAVETGHVIVREAEGRAVRPSQFPRLVRVHRLPSCPVRPMVDVSEITDLGESGVEGGAGVC